jgi:putative NADPH-quinone reductase
MKVLVIYAHPNPKSFNHAVVEEFTKGYCQINWGDW